MTGRNPGIVVFSGGTAANSLVDCFDELASSRNSLLTYAVAISDNGGSSSEINRFIGGPSVGDVRSNVPILLPPSPRTVLRQKKAAHIPPPQRIVPPYPLFLC
jgi:2-phospho-L-lactate transferase/gluconeogenesis factor (CofD/UPF0052 family)